MKAGRMKYRVTLLEPKKEINGFGEEKLEYVEVATVHAERVKMNGSRSEEVAEHFSDYSIDFNIRDAHKVGENWRLKQLGGYLYNITTVIPNIDRGFLTLKCERVNE